MKEKEIKTNKARCKKCSSVIESRYRHDFVWCKCGSIFVDGGKAYLRRGGNPEDFEDLSEFYDNKTSKSKN